MKESATLSDLQHRLKVSLEFHDEPFFKRQGRVSKGPLLRSGSKVTSYFFVNQRLSCPEAGMTGFVRNSRRRIRAQSASDPPMDGFRSSDHQGVRRLKQISCPTQSPHPGSRNRGDSNPPVAPWCLQKGHQQLQLHCLGGVSLWQCLPVSRDWPRARLPSWRLRPLPTHVPR